MDIVERNLAEHAYAEGFAVGVDQELRGTRKGRTLQREAYEEHWRKGFEAGKQAAREAREVYRAALKAKAA
jgi:hypothetical protein